MRNSQSCVIFNESGDALSVDKFGLITCEHSLGAQSIVDDCG